jgi:hypothetical protein
MNFLIGIDDTDNLDSRGTGYRARGLGALLQTMGLAVVGITRHQLLVDPQIPYTSHNSAACLVVQAPSERLDQMIETCRDYLKGESADGADVGLCLVAQAAAGGSIQEFGQWTKQRVLTRSAALDLARQENIFLEGLTGDGGGVIGALAAVGLRAGQNDGRFIWLAGVRELSGIYTAEALYRQTGIDEIRSLSNKRDVPVTARIDPGAWPRPILRDGRAVLLVEEVQDRDDCDWQVIAKETIKQYSD